MKRRQLRGGAAQRRACHAAMAMGAGPGAAAGAGRAGRAGGEGGGRGAERGTHLAPAASATSAPPGMGKGDAVTDACAVGRERAEGRAVHVRGFP